MSAPIVIDPNEDVEKFGLSKDDAKRLIQQVQYEYKTAKDWILPFYQKSYKNLKLYLNEKRDDDKVGDPLLYTIMNTIHASLYSDIPSVKWRGRTLDDIRMEYGLNLLTDFDYDQMNKGELDMDWLWDACFFGYGVVEMSYFDRTTKTPKPRLVDPFCFMYAPNTPSDLDDGDYCGEEFEMTRRQIKNSKVYQIDDTVKEGASFNDLPKMASQARSESQGKNEPIESADPGSDVRNDNGKIRVVEWRTWFNGKRIIVALANDMKKIVRYNELAFQDTWGYVTKRISKTSHQYKGSSIPDMVGDKQRMRSEIINLSASIAKSQQYPHYLYNSNLIKNRADLKHGFNKFTAVPGAPRDVVVPMNQYTPNAQLTDYILNFLDGAAQRATASAEMQQGALSGQERTLGELNLVAQKADTRYSLMMKNLLSGEKQFYMRWYALYKKYFNRKIDEKVIRLTGDMENQFTTVRRKDIISDAKVDPDVEIISTVIEEAKRNKEINKYVQLMNAVSSSPDADRRVLVKQFSEVLGMSEGEIDAIFPPTLDEINAELENIKLEGEQDPLVQAGDNDMVHLRIHRKAERNKHVRAHMLTHLEAMIQKKKNPNVDPNAVNAQMGVQGGLQAGESGSLNSTGFQSARAANKQTSGMTPAQDAKLSNGQNYGFTS